MAAGVYSLQTRNGGHGKASVLRSPTGPAKFQLQITITDVIVMEIFGEHYQNVTQRHEVSKYCWENDADRLSRPRVATNGQFVKKKYSIFQV